MAPSFATENDPEVAVSSTSTTPVRDIQSLRHGKPLELTGALNGFDYFDVTPCIGREYRNVDLVDWLKAPGSDEILRDLAITISQRGVVFFRKQDGINDELQKILMQRLGELSGKPSTSRLHIHPICPVSEQAQAVKGSDEEISVISSRFKEKSSKVYSSSKKASTGDKRGNKGYSDATKTQRKQSMKTEWHSDIAFEHVPSDYTMLRLTEIPQTGGDTLWASGYELYDRLSPTYQKFVETLTATYHYAGLDVFVKVAAQHGFKLHMGPRGAPENVGDEFAAVHPVVRTNPVTGWKSLYAIGHHFKGFNEITQEESKNLEDWFLKLLVENHDLQVRHRWENVNDVAIWDNRSTYHAATPDHLAFGHRGGHRAVSVGERPYLDPESKSRSESLSCA